MPRPVSPTSKVTSSSTIAALSQTRPPAGVYFSALPSRFVSVCTMRSGSASTGACRGVTSSEMPRRSAWACTASAASCMSSAASARSSWMGRRPHSSSWMSSMSLTSRLRRLVLPKAISTMRAARGGSSPTMPVLRSSRAPSIVLIGVRSSWLTIVTNSLLSRSISRRSVRSRMMPE
ncbi:hypothetical protein D3C72_906400 [compost metagenome]